MHRSVRRALLATAALTFLAGSATAQTFYFRSGASSEAAPGGSVEAGALSPNVSASDFPTSASSTWDVALVGSGGTPAYSFSATGLPPGTSLQDDRIVGTPAYGDWSIVITTTDSTGASTIAAPILVSVGTPGTFAPVLASVENVDVYRPDTIGDDIAVAFKNTGQRPAARPDLSVSGPYVVLNDGCPSTLNGGETCYVDVAASPDASAARGPIADGSLGGLPLAGNVYVPIVTLAAATTQTFPAANVGSPWTFDFSTLSTGSQDVPAGTMAYSLSAHPAWLSINRKTGIASGTPIAKGDASLQVVGTFKTVSGQREYTINVGGVVLRVTQISAGTNHTCAVTTSGAAKCWGQNVYGQLGHGDKIDSTTPVDVTELTSNVSQISAGDTHTCAVTASGAAKCWGQNVSGQLGRGDLSYSTTPVDVTDLTSNVSQISAGTYHTCVVTASGAAKCWGYGPLGHGDLSYSTSPVDVTDLTSNVSQISVNAYHTCAVTTSGAAKCWGQNSYGELGRGNKIDSTTPVDVTDLTSGALQISAGGQHTCAITTSGAAKCWGYNGKGQLGRGDNSTIFSPTDVERP